MIVCDDRFQTFFARTMPISTISVSIVSYMLICSLKKCLQGKKNCVNYLIQSLNGFNANVLVLARRYVAGSHVVRDVVGEQLPEKSTGDGYYCMN